jgi:hypothetical protein
MVVLFRIRKLSPDQNHAISPEGEIPELPYFEMRDNAGYAGTMTTNSSPAILAPLGELLWSLLACLLCGGYDNDGYQQPVMM